MHRVVAICDTVGGVHKVVHGEEDAAQTPTDEGNGHQRSEEDAEDGGHLTARGGASNVTQPKLRGTLNAT